MGENIGLGYSVPQEQRLSYRITPQAGSIMNAESVGGQIVALSKMLRACANQEEESKKLKWIVGITRIDTSEDGQITFDLVLLPKNPAPAQTEMAV